MRCNSEELKPVFGLAAVPYVRIRTWGRRKEGVHVCVRGGVASLH